jgi:hypothetical protein
MPSTISGRGRGVSHVSASQRRRPRGTAAVLTVLFLALLASLLSGTSPAAAGAPSAPVPPRHAVTDVPEIEGGEPLVGYRLGTPTDGTAKAPVADALEPMAVASRVDEARHRLEYPDGTIDTIECEQDGFGNQTGGYVVSHYAFCQNIPAAAYEYTCWKKILGVCIGRTLKASVEFDVTVVGYGWDGTMLKPDETWVDPTMNQISFVTRFHNWRNKVGTYTEMSLQLNIDCIAQDAGFPCYTDLLLEPQTKTVAEWMADGGQIVRFLSDQPAVDRTTHFDFNYHLDGPGDEEADHVVGNTFRCDLPSYPTKGGRGCMFDNADLIFDQLTLDPTAPYAQEADHIYDAFFDSANTEPRPPEGEVKDVPGNLDSASPRSISRGPRDGRSHDRAVATCVSVWGAGYTQNGTLDCDEYPFASTFEGAYYADPAWNYSARPILLGHNRSGGSRLGLWYEDQRMLYGDHFYVWLFGGRNGGGGGGTGTPWPSPGGSDSPPVVSAGPDVTGAEGASVGLAGSASDDGDLSVHWTYSAGDDVDTGATCSFGNARRAATTITCTDDGTFTVRLTADDGTNDPVSDSATVTLDNVAPRITSTSPEPWHLARARTPVDVAVTFVDPGANDTHTCSIDWDEGAAAQAVPAQGASCSTRHTFADAGMFSSGITVTDDDGASSAGDDGMIVVYDPEGGWNNSDGSFPSKAGLLLSQPSAAGELWFSLTARYYRPTDTVPVGTAKTWLTGTGFRIDAGDKGLKWLVVTPDGKVAAMATGKMQGRPESYGILFYGYDGCTAAVTTGCQAGADRFRTAVWPLADGPYPQGDTLYDSQPGSSYDVDDATPQDLKSGAVLIQRPK